MTTTRGKHIQFLTYTTSRSLNVFIFKFFFLLFCICFQHVFVVENYFMLKIFNNFYYTLNCKYYTTFESTQERNIFFPLLLFLRILNFTCFQLPFQKKNRKERKKVKKKKKNEAKECLCDSVSNWRNKKWRRKKEREEKQQEIIY